MNRITNDLADDFHPRFINNMEDISFVSNRRLDTLFMENDPENNTTTAFAVFVYDYAGKIQNCKKYPKGTTSTIPNPCHPAGTNSST